MLKERPLSDFSIIIPAPERQSLAACVTIHKDSRFTMNSKLTSVLGGKNAQIMFTSNGKGLCLLEAGGECGENIMRLPKNGTLKHPRLTDMLEQLSVDFPAKYEMRYFGSTKSWQGEYCENPTRSPLKKTRSSRQK